MSPAFSRIANESMPARFSSTPIAIPENPLPTMTIGKSLMLADDAKTSPEPRRVDVDHAPPPAARRREAPRQDRLRGALRERRDRGRRAHGLRDQPPRVHARADPRVRRLHAPPIPCINSI